MNNSIQSLEDTGLKQVISCLDEKELNMILQLLSAGIYFKDRQEGTYGIDNAPFAGSNLLERSVNVINEPSVLKQTEDICLNCTTDATSCN